MRDEEIGGFRNSGIGELLERLPAAINLTEMPGTRKTSLGQKAKAVYEIP
jgi:tRNA 2-selenouridine synthase SelU